MKIKDIKKTLVDQDIEKTLAQDLQDFCDKYRLMDRDTRNYFGAVLYDVCATRGLFGQEPKVRLEKLKETFGMYDDKGLNALVRLVNTMRHPPNKRRKQ